MAMIGVGGDVNQQTAEAIGSNLLCDSCYGDSHQSQPGHQCYYGNYNSS